MFFNGNINYNYHLTSGRDISLLRMIDVWACEIDNINSDVYIVLGREEIQLYVNIYMGVVQTKSTIVGHSK